MSKVTNIHEYKKLNRIVKELPEVLKLLNKFQQDLYPYMHYQDVGILNSNINAAKDNFNSKLDFCKRRLEREF
jgi:hypothetical protein